MLCQHAIDDDDGRPGEPGVRPELTAGGVHRWRGPAVSAAAEFEELTGAKILQFYGSNETGLLSATTLADPLERRLRSGGRIVPEMAVRLFGGDDGDTDVTDSGRGQPACRGPATSPGI